LLGVKQRLGSSQKFGVDILSEVLV